MKKIYCSPEIRLIYLQTGKLMVEFITDSMGLDNDFKARENRFDEEEASTPIAVNIWDE